MWTTAQKIFAVATAAVIVFIAGCSSSSKDSGTPVSCDEAVQIVLDEVVGNSSGHDIVARMWNEPLGAGAVVSNEFAGDGKGRISNGSEWFAWIDDEPFAFYSHGVRYAYVNATTGAVEIEEADEAPTLNGSLLWETEEGFDDRSSVIFDNTAASSAVNNSSATAQYSGLASILMAQGYIWPADNVYAAPASDNQDDQCCQGKGERVALILYNYDNGNLRKDISDNVKSMAAALANNSFTVPSFTSSTGSGDIQSAIYLGDEKGTGLQQLRDFVKEHSGPEHCCDEIVIYYTGHGSSEQAGGQTRYYFGTRFNYRGEDGKRTGQNRLYAEDLAQILSGLGSCHIQVIIDACHSGGFRSAIMGLKGVETFWPSAAEDEVAYGGYYDKMIVNGVEYTDPDGRADNESGSEYTSGFVKGLNDRAAAIKAGATPVPAGELMEIGADGAWDNDLARIAGKTHPLGSRRLPGTCDCCKDTSTPGGDTDTGTGGEEVGNAPGAAAQEVAVRFAVFANDLAYISLPEDNIVLHSNAVYTVVASGATDMIVVGKAEFTLTEEEYEQLFGNTDFPCGEGDYGLTLCPDDAVEEAGDYYLLWAEFVGDVPHADAEYLYQIGFVFDSDGNASNNYQPSSSWPADFFKNTDRWYVAQYAPGGGWTMSVSNANMSAPVASGARSIINGNAVVLVLPASEISPSQASFRITAFRHDGSYGLSGGFWNADLSTAVSLPMLSFE